jgi:hypothetical protein
MTGTADACAATSRAEGEAPDLIRGKSVKPKVVETKPVRVKRTRKVTADEPDLIGAK